VIGAYAVGIYAQPRATKDLDIFIGTDTANGTAVWRALAKFGAPLGDLPPDKMAEPEPFFTWGYPPYRIDILTTISGIEFEEAWSRRVLHPLDKTPGLTAPFISVEDLIKNKLASGRHYDLGDVEAIRQAAKQRPGTTPETIYDRHPGLTRDVEPERDDDLTRDPPGRGRRR
jgi:hypothetical protein